MVQSEFSHRAESGFLREFVVARDEEIDCDGSAKFEVTRRGEIVSLLWGSDQSFVPEETNNPELVVDVIMCDDPITHPPLLEIKSNLTFTDVKIEIESVQYPAEKHRDVLVLGGDRETDALIRCALNQVTVYEETESCSDDSDGDEICYDTWTKRFQGDLNLSEGVLVIDAPFWGSSWDVKTHY